MEGDQFGGRHVEHHQVGIDTGGFEGRDPAQTRRRLRAAKWAITAFFLVLGLLTLAAYYRIGVQLPARAQPSYVPGWLADPPTAPAPAWWPGHLSGPYRHH